MPGLNLSGLVLTFDNSSCAMSIYRTAAVLAACGSSPELPCARNKASKSKLCETVADVSCGRAWQPKPCLLASCMCRVDQQRCTGSQDCMFAMLFGGGIFVLCTSSLPGWCCGLAAGSMERREAGRLMRLAWSLLVMPCLNGFDIQQQLRPTIDYHLCCCTQMFCATCMV